MTTELAIFRAISGQSGVDQLAKNLIPVLARRGYRIDQFTVLLAAKDRAIRMVVLARALNGAKIRLIGQLDTHLSAALALQRPWRTFPMP